MPHNIAHVHASVSNDRHSAVVDLHARCGVYTQLPLVNRILDAVGWRAELDLSTARLLEPAAGDGAFLIEAVRRLIQSLRSHGIEPRLPELSNRIMAFELHPSEAAKARRRLLDELLAQNIPRTTAHACSKRWVRTGDFFLADVPLGSFSHVVGNPPYVRWSKIPPLLRRRYARHVPAGMQGGDLFLPFLDRALEALSSGAVAGLVCSDRWRFMQFASAFRSKWLPLLDITELSVAANEAFARRVDTYASVLLATRRQRARSPNRDVRSHNGKQTLEELGCVVRVGPALGCTQAFVLDATFSDVEMELLVPWLDASEIQEGAIRSRGRRLVTMHSTDGSLVSLEEYPRLKQRLAKYSEQLRGRSIVSQGDTKWYRPIDKVRAIDWQRPKLLVPEIARVPRCAIDTSGAIPSHGVYAIFCADDDVSSLYAKLRDGRLARALEPIAPRLKGGYFRCYKRFLATARF